MAAVSLVSYGDSIFKEGSKIGRLRQDISGQTFGRLTVLYLDEEKTRQSGKHGSYWICQCSCGNITKPINIGDLKKGHTKSCGCLLREQCAINAQSSAITDMAGKRFGKLVVTRAKTKEEYPKNKMPKVIEWYCDCDCGTKDHVVEGTSLRAGRIKSCGCLTKESAHQSYKDMTGQRVGLLTVLHMVNEEYHGRKNGVRWLCKCDCGKETIVSQNALALKKKISCGCITSKNEQKIKELLDKFNINYIHQYRIDDCRNPATNYLLPFDFAIFDNDNQLSFLLEYDGEQHFSEQRYSKDKSINEKKFEEVKWRDSYKNHYAYIHNIDLLRISCFEKEKLEQILINNLKQKGLLKDEYTV